LVPAHDGLNTQSLEQILLKVLAAMINDSILKIPQKENTYLALGNLATLREKPYRKTSYKNMHIGRGL
jgi:hypothetical protein